MDKRQPVSLVDISTYLPGEPIGADYYAQFADSDDLRDNLMFRAPKFRHHVAQDETAIDMVERAAAGLVERHGADTIADVDASGLWPGPVVTEVEPASDFWEAEPEHQDYFARNPWSGYCRAVVAPKVQKFRKTFADRVKRPAA